MKSNKNRPAQLDNVVSAIRQEAHEKVLSRGLVQFRLDTDYMQRLLETADEKGLGYGVLARMWVCERLEQERRGKSKSPLPIESSAIRTMIKEEIQAALSASTQKGLKK